MHFVHFLIGLQSTNLRYGEFEVHGCLLAYVRCQVVGCRKFQEKENACYVGEDEVQRYVND